MSVSIRLTPFGRKKKRKYRILAAETRRRIHGRYAADLGFFDPDADHGRGLVVIRRRNWLRLVENGAIPSARLLSILRNRMRPDGPLVLLTDSDDYPPDGLTPTADGRAPVQLPISPAIGIPEAGAFEVSLRIPGSGHDDLRKQCKGDPLDWGLTQRPVAQFTIQEKGGKLSREVLAVFVDLANPSNDWSRTSFRWKYSMPLSVAWLSALRCLRAATDKAAPHVAFESAGELLDAEIAAEDDSTRALDHALSRLGELKRIHLFVDQCETVIEPADTGDRRQGSTGGGMLSISVPIARSFNRESIGAVAQSVVDTRNVSSRPHDDLVAVLEKITAAIKKQVAARASA